MTQDAACESLHKYLRSERPVHTGAVGDWVLTDRTVSLLNGVPTPLSKIPKDAEINKLDVKDGTVRTIGFVK